MDLLISRERQTIVRRQQKGGIPVESFLENTFNLSKNSGNLKQSKFWRGSEGGGGKNGQYRPSLITHC